MRFRRLYIFWTENADVAGGDYDRLVACHYDVTVADGGRDGPSLVARDRSGTVVAALNTWDDDPVRFQAGCLRIDGGLVPPPEGADYEYGTWLLA